MSTISATPTAALNLAGSVIGSSRPEAATDRAKAASAEQKTLTDRQAALSKALGDVADPEFGAERDADGRLLYRRATHAAAAALDDSTASSEPRSPSPAADAFGDRGNSLDVEA